MIPNGAIIITGGSGYLGRGILRRAEQEHATARITVYSRDEHKQAKLRARFPHARYILGDVRDYDRLEAAVAGHDIVIHAAAAKHIPEAEEHVGNAIEANVIGSMNVARAARRAGVRCVVGLSTDKAAGPLNAYGMTKGLMERIFGEADRWGQARFSCVRYGNVVSSSGSVVPLFRRQLATTGRISLTDTRMTRFWLSVDEAIDLIIEQIQRRPDQAGDVMVPLCGAMPVIELARMVAGDDAPIDAVGMRPGEKLHETLVLDAELPRTGLWFGEEIRAVTIASPLETSLRASPLMAEYRSDAPAFWVTRARMQAMIDDATALEALA